MNNVNPALASTTQALYMQASGFADNTAKDPKVTDKTSPETSSADNTTVTLSEQSQQVQNDYADLANVQTVNGNTSVEDAPVESNQTTEETTYSASLEARANYYQSQETEINP